MLSKDNYFRLAASAIIIQQLLLAASTWSIALAGSAVSSNHYDQVVHHIVAFFLLALAAYVASSVSEFLTLNAANTTWKCYSKNLISESCNSVELSSEKNRRSISIWLSSEAMSTISNGVGFYLGALSTICNILFTGAVFYISLGFALGTAVAGCLVLSLVLVYLTKDKISTIASKIQADKINALNKLDSFLVNGFFGTDSMREKSSISFDQDVNTYFKSTQAYVKIEQLLACIPIAISVAILSLSVSFLNPTSAVELGILVAVLPRSLQLLGNVHSLSIYLSQFISVRQKIRNLETFIHDLERQDFTTQIKAHALIVTDLQQNQTVTAQAPLEAAQMEYPKGRYVIRGSNGVGKSTLLRQIKSIQQDAILLTPGAKFSSFMTGQSTGQAHLEELKALLTEKSKVLLLDEWDANLDRENVAAIDELLSLASESALIIEVRHHYEYPISSQYGSEGVPSLSETHNQI